MLNTEHRSRVLSDIAAEAVPPSMDLWPALDQRLSARPPVQVRRAGRRAPGLIAAAVVLLALVAVAVVPFWSAPATVSAETILDRAATAASTGTSTVSTYHLLLTRASTDAGATTSEVWYGGPDRQRTIQQAVGPNGATLSRQEVVFDGPDTWIETTDQGVTRVIHTIGTTWTKPAESPSDQPNLPELLRAFGDQSCLSARLEQTTATVAGQDTYVILARPAAFGCAPSAAAAAVEASPGPAGAQPRVRVNGQPAGGLVTQPSELTVWVDKRSFLPLKIEARDAHGVVVDRSEVTRVEYNLFMTAATFAYTPPPGVPVATFSGGSGADVKRLMASESDSRTPPRKSP